MKPALHSIHLDQVRKVFNQGKANEFCAIQGIDLHIDPQTATVLKGPSGSGKSTLLSMIGCLSRPTSGRITLGDKNISGIPERFMTEIRRSTFGFIFQQFNLIQGLTVLENVILPAYPLGPEYTSLKEAGTQLLHQFGLSDKATSRVEWLSGGEKQRCAICRAMINDPEILIADEPTANLDSRLSEEFMQMVDGFKANGKTILLSSHDPLVYQSSIIDRTVGIQDGLLKD